MCIYVNKRNSAGIIPLIFITVIDSVSFALSIPYEYNPYKLFIRKYAE
jgi:hypothetical protein